ncbi:Pleckstrin homology domain-containing protein [Phycomyces nitens]|nr:Pleckstrin homology domain-containing protein [Phycomyces nitens]
MLKNNPDPLDSPNLSSISSSSSAAALSIPTIRPPPTSQRALVDEEIGQPIPEPPCPESLFVKPQLTKKRSLVERLSLTPKKLLWHKAGGVFVPTMQVPENRKPAKVSGQPIKHDVMLCVKTMSCQDGSEPSRYRASKEARLNMFKGNWRQLETILTSDAITIYSNSLLHWPKRYEEYKIVFSEKDRPAKLRLSLVSPLDYTFCLKYKSKVEGEYITITFRARSVTMCQEWYMAIYSILPDECRTPCPLFCEVFVPEMDIRIHLPLILNENRLVPCYDITAENIKDVLLAMIHEDEDFENRVKEQLGRGTFGLCWTRRDRAEWIYWKNNVDNDGRRDVVICPQSIEKTHQLELRHVEHKPHDVILEKDMTLEEPRPIEGFLTRLTDYHGREIRHRQLIRRRHYISSFDQYLFYTKPSKVTIAEPKCFVSGRELGLTTKPCPYIGLISPYSGLGAGLEVNERKRRMKLIEAASGLIDLTEVAYVRRAFSATFTHSGISESDSLGATSTTPALHRLQSDQNYTHRPQDHDIGHLEIIMNSGVVIKYEAFSNETSDAWVHQLGKLIVYWKALKEGERDVHARNNFYDGLNQHMQLALEENPVQLPKDEECLADTRIWNLCMLEQCRDVMKSGIMYCQPHSRGTFTQKLFVLTTSGVLVFYDIFKRSSMVSQPLITASHAKKGTFDISNCFVFSGDLSMDMDRPPSRPPRMFSDGLVTEDSDTECIFTLWKPLLRRTFSPQRQRIMVYKTDFRPNPEGETWTFLAKSRQEREEWVWAINQIIESTLRSHNMSQKQKR